MHALQVYAALLEGACGHLKDLVITRGHAHEVRTPNSHREVRRRTPGTRITSTYDIASDDRKARNNSNSNDRSNLNSNSNVLQQACCSCEEENGRALWGLQLALERSGGLQRLELHGQTILPSEVSTDQHVLLKLPVYCPKNRPKLVKLYILQGVLDTVCMG